MGQFIRKVHARPRPFASRDDVAVCLVGDDPLLLDRVVPAYGFPERVAFFVGTSLNSAQGEEFANVLAPINSLCERYPVFEVRDNGLGTNLVLGILLQPGRSENPFRLDLAVFLDGDVVVDVTRMYGLVARLLRLQVGCLFPRRDTAG